MNFSLPFNPKPSTYLHLDLNSCFATIEQQANPHLRGKPIAVAAYTTPSGCILAPSVEAKRLGVKVGMRVKEGKLICPELTVLAPDPWKYRNVHLKLRRLLEIYTELISPKSIDEFVLNLEGYPAYQKGMASIAREIKSRIKTEIGEWLTVSVGIAPNRFLAKTAAGLHKPDGLDEINAANFETIYQHLSLTDICGIKRQNQIRLNQAGLYSMMDFYHATIPTLMAAFGSIVGYYWYLRLHGWEIDDIEFGRKSFGNSYALPEAFSRDADLLPILMKLVQKMSSRLRKQGYLANGVHYSVLFRDGTHWHQGMKTKTSLFATNDLYRAMVKLYKHCPYQKPVANLAVSCFDLESAAALQLDMFGDTLKKQLVYTAVDQVNERYGNYVLTPALMLGTAGNVPDRIAFGGMKELEELVFTAPARAAYTK